MYQPLELHIYKSPSPAVSRREGLLLFQGTLCNPIRRLCNIPGIDPDPFAPAPLDHELLRSARKFAVAERLGLNEPAAIAGDLDRAIALIRLLLLAQEVDPRRPLSDCGNIDPHAP